jgi:hypothetical protein
VCATPVEETTSFAFGNSTLVFNCPSASWLGAITIFGSNVVFVFQHIAFNSVIHVSGGGTLIFEDCVLEGVAVLQGVAGVALDVEPSSPLNLIVTNSRISNNDSGVLLKPAAGGSVTATFNGVTIDGNSGGGLKGDSTNGPVTVDISNSTISKNAGNGMNAVGGAGGANMFNIRSSIIAANGSAGVQANGATAAALINNTLLDSNATGATTAINGGRLLSYGNNSIVGPAGSGFTGSVPLQ